jgi:hypothetical protein
MPWLREDDWNELRELFADADDPFSEIWKVRYSFIIAAEAYLKKHDRKVITVQMRLEELPR